MTNRDGRRAGESPEFTLQDSIRILQSVAASYTNPPQLKPGDLIQSKAHFASWSGFNPETRAALIVVAVYPDMGAVTKEASDIGVPGIKFASLEVEREGVHTWIQQAWHFEPYTGPMPDAY
jgi:uncharacterized protein with NRDE domain